MVGGNNWVCFQGLRIRDRYEYLGVFDFRAPDIISVRNLEELKLLSFQGFTIIHTKGFS